MELSICKSDATRFGKAKKKEYQVFQRKKSRQIQSVSSSFSQTEGRGKQCKTFGKEKEQAKEPLFLHNKNKGSLTV